MTVFIVFLLWSLDKFFRPDHAAAVFKTFYSLPNLALNLVYVVGALELMLCFLFLFGIAKKYSYGLVLLLHFISTISTFKQYLTPYVEIHLLFFTAFPMLAACLTLYLLRDYDTILVLNRKKTFEGDL